jgi:hypothetical protein
MVNKRKLNVTYVVAVTVHYLVRKNHVGVTVVKSSMVSDTKLVATIARAIVVESLPRVLVCNVAQRVPKQIFKIL